MYYSPPRPDDLLRIDYRVPPDRQLPIEQLYYCDQCCCLLSRYDLMEELDTFYCVQCMESLPSTEALVYRNCCFRCFDCPRCRHVLSYVSDQTTGDSSTVRKEAAAPPEPVNSSTKVDSIYRLACTHCHWTSSHLGLEAPKLDSLIMETVERTRDSAYQHFAAHLSACVKRSIQAASAKHRGAFGRRPGALRPLPAGDEFRESPEWTEKFVERRKRLPYQDANEMKMAIGWGSGVRLGFYGAGDGGAGYARARLKWTDALQEELLKNEKFRNFSVWDTLMFGLEEEFAQGGRTGRGLCVPMVSLTTLTPETKSEAQQFIKELDAVNPSAMPTQEQFLRQVNINPRTLDVLLPVPKALMSKRSHRCRKCHRYVVRTQINPNAPLRLNNTAKAAVPRLILFRVLTEKALEHEEVQPLPMSLADRFPSVTKGCTMGFDFELVNTQSYPLKLSFDLSRFTEEEDMTLEILTGNFDVTVVAFDEFQEDVGDSGDDKEKAGREELSTPAVISKDHHKLQIRLKMAVKEGTPSGSIAKCAFNMTVTSEKIKGLSMTPVSSKSHKIGNTVCGCQVFNLGRIA